jgi:hypothetical protein
LSAAASRIVVCALDEKLLPEGRSVIVKTCGRSRVLMALKGLS